MQLRRVLPLALAVMLISACSSNDTSVGGPASATIVTTTTISSAAPGATAPTSQPTTSEPTVVSTEQPVVGEPAVASEPIGEFDGPVDLAVRPGDEAFWIVEQAGRVIRFDGTTSTVALDLSGRVSGGGERGLLGLEFAPAGTLAYVNFTDANGDTVIAEYRVAPDGSLDEERVLLVVPQPFGNHNAGDLAFGPDGMLYIPLGDGGSAGDPQRNGSDPATLLGSLLRIDPAPGEQLPYTIPADNPFAGGATFEGVTGAPEVWAWGLRNPWKIAFDPATGALWIPDVGQNEFEEINVVEPEGKTAAGRGADFGWSAFEGTERFNDDVADSGRTTRPSLTYGHDDGCSISGGAPYRGAAIAGLAPAFVYSDYCAGTIWAFDLAGSRNLTLLDGFTDVTAIRAGPDGELYVLERGGTVHRLVPG